MLDKDSRILVVDDFEMVRVMLKNALAQLGLNRVDFAEDGGSALKKVESAHGEGDPYSLVFLDWNMPIKSGFEALGEIKASETHKDIPVIMVTAESEKSQVIKALTAGASDYIVKPCNANLLKSKIERLKLNTKDA